MNFRTIPLAVNASCTPSPSDTPKQVIPTAFRPQLAHLDLQGRCDLRHGPLLRQRRDSIIEMAEGPTPILHQRPRSSALAGAWLKTVRRGAAGQNDPRLLRIARPLPGCQGGQGIRGEPNLTPRGAAITLHQGDAEAPAHCWRPPLIGLDSASTLERTGGTWAPLFRSQCWSGC